MGGWTFRRRWWCAVILAGCAGCAGTPAGRGIEQEIRVETPGCPSVRCELRNDRGQWVVERTPGAVTVRTSDKPLEVSCRVPDVTAGTARMASRQGDKTAGATAAGGAVGAGVGAAVAAPGFALGGPFGVAAAVVVVAAATGGSAIAHAADESQRAFTYPSPVQLILQCVPPDAGAAGLGSMTWGLAVRGAPEGDDAATGAVRVVALSPGGRAAAAGLHAGDLRVALDGRPIGGTLGLEDALRSLRSAAVLTVRRGTEVLELTLTPPGPRR